MDVGIRELKQHLSQYLERAARGEIIRVTDRGRPKAVLGPPPGVLDLSAAVAEGWVRPGGGAEPAPVQRARSKGRVLSALDDDRGP
jgi:prevent-host-death family protein